MITSFLSIFNTCRYLDLHFLPYKYYFYNSSTETMLCYGFNSRMIYLGLH